MYIKEYQVGNKVYEDVIGSLHVANTTDLDKAVYFKILHQHFSTQDDLVEAFHKSAEFYCSLEYENHINALEHGQENGKHFLVLEYSNLSPLEKILNKKQVFSLIDAITLIENISKILRVYHIDGIIHGNLTSQNIFCDENVTQVKISDFGFQEFTNLLIQKKQPGLLNTLTYCAPELIQGEEKATRSSDIYSIGVLFYRILLGNFPWNGKGFHSNRYMSSEIAIIPPSLQRLEIPDFLDTIICKSLEPEIENRFQNISQFIKKISEAKASILASVTPVTSHPEQNEQPDEQAANDQFELLNSDPSPLQNNNNLTPELQKESLKEQKAEEPSQEKQNFVEDALSKEKTYSDSQFQPHEHFDELPSIPQNDVSKESSALNEEKTEISPLIKEETTEGSLNSAPQFSQKENEKVAQFARELDLQVEPFDNQNNDGNVSSSLEHNYQQLPVEKLEKEVQINTPGKMKLDDESLFHQQDYKSPVAEKDQAVDNLPSNKADPMPASQPINYDGVDMHKRDISFPEFDDFKDDTATQTEEMATTHTLNLYREQIHRPSFRSIIKFVFILIIPLLLLFILTSIVFDYDWNALFPGLKNSILSNKINALKQSDNVQTSTVNTKKSSITTNRAREVQKPESANINSISKNKTNSLPSQTGLERTASSLARQSTQPTSVTLTLTVRNGQIPQISEVYLDGAFLGKTTSNGQISITKLTLNKSYLFKVEKSGFEMWAKEIMFNRVGQINLNVNLRASRTVNPAY